MESLKNWMMDAANILFDDSKNDLRSLPKNCKITNPFSFKFYLDYSF